MKIVEDNSTVVLNGLSPVDEEIDNIDDDYLEVEILLFVNSNST